MIKIAHLYYDLLNLYGESGNIKELKYQIEYSKEKVKIDLLTIGDKIDLKKYDLIYIGSGTNYNIKLVLKDILKYKKDINDFIKNNKIFIATGSSLDLFGKKIIDGKKSYKTLNIFNYETTWNDKRLVDEMIVKARFVSKPIIGFQNQNSSMNTTKGSFKVIKGIGAFQGSKYEGIVKNNFIGTYLLGPLLVRNPQLTEHILNKLNIKNKNFDFDLNKKAFNKYAKIYYNEIFNEKDYY